MTDLKQTLNQYCYVVVQGDRFESPDPMMASNNVKFFSRINDAKRRANRLKERAKRYKDTRPIYIVTCNPCIVDIKDA